MAFACFSVTATAQEGSPVEESAETPTETASEPTEETTSESLPETKGADVESDEIKRQLRRLEAEKAAYTLQVEHAEAKLASLLLEKKVLVDKMKMEIEEIKARAELAEVKRKEAVSKEIADLRSENEKLVLELASAKARAEKYGYEVKVAEAKVKAQISEMSLAMDMIEKEMDARNYANAKPVYLKEPLVGKRLTISDRRIELNGSISSRTAEHVSERIHYFNNRDKEMPIFIVIDNSPGGSVMSGYKILKAMQGSQAPVYVVVKQFAASMAACITTLADRSFAYPNAIILHHQLSGGVNGNLTQQREWVDEMEEWWKRLATPVAKKMGLSLEEFIAEMYKNNSRGDWEEFADKAKDLKWVDHIVDEIRETSLYRNPDFRKSSLTTTAILRGDVSPEAEAGPRATGEQVDERGRPFFRLPRLSPPDVYWLYNPDGYYRLP